VAEVAERDFFWVAISSLKGREGGEKLPALQLSAQSAIFLSSPQNCRAPTFSCFSFARYSVDRRKQILISLSAFDDI
jgi:hypothetical protein